MKEILSSIENNPEYQKLSDPDKISYKKYFLDKHIINNPAFKSLDPSDKVQFRTDFINGPEKPINILGETAKGVGKSLAGGFKTAFDVTLAPFVFTPKTYKRYIDNIPTPPPAQYASELMGEYLGMEFDPNNPGAGFYPTGKPGLLQIGSIAGLTPAIATGGIAMVKDVWNRWGLFDAVSKTLQMEGEFAPQRTMQQQITINVGGKNYSTMVSFTEKGVADVRLLDSNLIKENLNGISKIGQWTSQREGIKNALTSLKRYLIYRPGFYIEQGYGKDLLVKTESMVFSNPSMASAPDFYKILEVNKNIATVQSTLSGIIKEIPTTAFFQSHIGLPVASLIKSIENTEQLVPEIATSIEFKTEQTLAGKQTLIPGTEGRSVPNAPIKAKVNQVEPGQVLEGFKESIKEPSLFEAPKPWGAITPADKEEWMLFYQSHPQYQEQMSIEAKDFRATPTEDLTVQGQAKALEDVKNVASREDLLQLRLALAPEVDPDYRNGYMNVLYNKLDEIRQLDPNAYKTEVETLATQMRDDAVKFGIDPIAEYVKRAKVWISPEWKGKDRDLPSMYKSRVESRGEVHYSQPDEVATFIANHPEEFPNLPVTDRKDFNGASLLYYLSQANAKRPSNKVEDYTADAEERLRQLDIEMFESAEEATFADQELYSFDDSEGGFLNLDKLKRILVQPRFTNKGMEYFNTAMTFKNKSLMGYLYALMIQESLGPRIMPEERSIITDLLASSETEKYLNQIRPERRDEVMSVVEELRGVYNKFFEIVNAARIARGEKPIGYLQNFSPIRFKGTIGSEVWGRLYNQFSTFFASALHRKFDDWEKVKQWAKINGYELITDPIMLVSSYMVDSVRYISEAQLLDWFDANYVGLLMESAKEDPIINEVFNIKFNIEDKKKYGLPDNSMLYSKNGKSLSGMVQYLKQQGVVNNKFTTSDLVLKLSKYLREAEVTISGDPAFEQIRKVQEIYDEEAGVTRELYRKMPTKYPKAAATIIKRWNMAIDPDLRKALNYWISGRRAIVDLSFLLPTMHAVNLGSVLAARYGFNLLKTFNILAHSKLKNMNADERNALMKEMMEKGRMEPAKIYEARRKMFEYIKKSDNAIDKLMPFKNEKLFQILNTWREFDRTLLFTKFIGNLSMEAYMAERDDAIKRGASYDEACADAGEIVNDMMGSLNSYIFGAPAKYYLMEVLLMFPRWWVSNLRYISGAMGPLGSATGPLGKVLPEWFTHQDTQEQAKRRMWSYIQILLGAFVLNQILNTTIQTARMAYNNAKRRKLAKQGKPHTPFEAIRVPLQNPGIKEKLDIYWGNGKYVSAPWFRFERQAVNLGVAIFSLNGPLLWNQFKNTLNRVGSLALDFAKKIEDMQGAPRFVGREVNIAGEPTGRVVGGYVVDSLEMALQAFTAYGSYLPPGKEMGRSPLEVILALNGCYTYNDRRMPVFSSFNGKNISEMEWFTPFYNKLSANDKKDFNEQTKTGAITGDMYNKLEKFLGTYYFVNKKIEKIDKEGLRKIDPEKFMARDPKAVKAFTDIVEGQLKTGRYKTDAAIDGLVSYYAWIVVGRYTGSMTEK
ncbi:MAG: hypothetical protein PHY56_00295 [Candidatus Omnitrophica bacterium]|nr:hypothetical protein [Candidatus Omnitrophota bacterium]